MIGATRRRRLRLIGVLGTTLKMARRDYGLPGYSVVLFGRKSDRRPSKHSCLVEDRSERVNEFDVIGNEQACYYMDSEWNRSAHEGLLFWISVVVRNQDRGTALGDLVRRTVESMARSRTASIFVGVRREPEEGVISCEILSCFCGCIPDTRMTVVLGACGLPRDSYFFVKKVEPREVVRWKQEMALYISRPALVSLTQNGSDDGLM